MKKNWDQRKIEERIYGNTITRWYIKSPTENLYFIYRGRFDKSIYLTSIENGKEVNKNLGTSYHDAIKEIYRIDGIEKNDKYKNFIIKNYQLECAELFKQKEKHTITQSW